MSHVLLRRFGIFAKRVLLPVRLSLIFSSRLHIRVVQIGSNDGKSGDPLHRLLIENTEWRALFVEPVPYLFCKLKLNYPEHSRFVFENVAIGHQFGTTSFYFVDPSARSQNPELPAWVEQLGSFDRGYIERHFGGFLCPYINELQVEIIPLNDLLTKHGFQGVDLLHVDTEGYDFEVIRQLDFRCHRPRAILFEHKHLRQSDRFAAIQMLKRADYRLEKWGGDYLCTARR